jgi:hypothetical protein
MGLIDNTSSQSEIYFEVTGAQKPFRPLSKDTTSIWCHSIPGVDGTSPEGKPFTERKYSTELCVSTGRSGTGCNPCSTQDPLWHKLDKNTQTNRKGARADFPKKVIHLLPVLDLTTGKVRILKGGNKTFENMGGWLATQAPNVQDLRRCEWNIWKEGKGIKTSYHTVRSDATPFTITPEVEAEMKLAIDKAQKDMAPSSREAFLEMIYGETGLIDSPAGNQVAVTMPAFTQVSEAPPVTQVITQTVVSPPPPPPAAVPAFTFAEASSAASVKPNMPTSPVAPPTASVVEEFTVWCNSQPEFQGVGTFNNLIPVLQEKIGGVNYHSCTNEQLVMLKEALTTKLNTIRVKKV